MRQKTQERPAGLNLFRLLPVFGAIWGHGAKIPETAAAFRLVGGPRRQPQVAVVPKKGVQEIRRKGEMPTLKQFSQR